MKDVDLMEKCLEDARKLFVGKDSTETAVAIIAAELYFTRSEDVLLEWEGGETEDIPF